jgi:hypothetical protein
MKLKPSYTWKPRILISAVGEKLLY